MISNKDKYIKSKVYVALSIISGYTIDVIKDDSDLKIDLGLNDRHKMSLRNDFQQIVSDLNSSSIITLNECKLLRKVGNCLELVKSKI
jgi:hypothetical protein